MACYMSVSSRQHINQGRLFTDTITDSCLYLILSSIASHLGMHLHQFTFEAGLVRDDELSPDVMVGLLIRESISMLEGRVRSQLIYTHRTCECRIPRVY